MLRWAKLYSRTLQLVEHFLGNSRLKVTSDSRITHGQFCGVSQAKLLELVARLGHDVKIVVGPVRRGAGKIELQFA